LNVPTDAEYEKRSMSYFAKFLVGSFVFFIIAVGIGAYLFFNGSNIVSANNVDIAISGPVSVAGGDPFDMNVQVVNKNSVKLEVVDLSATFPAGTANPDDVTQEMKDYRELLDDIAPGGVDQKTVRTAMFGEENTKKTIQFKVEYRVAGSNAVFTKLKSYDVILSSSPVSLSISTFKEVTSGQDFDVAVTVASNSKNPLRNLILKGVYPAGFTFVSSDVKPVGNSATWIIGDLPEKGKKVITIKGHIDGQDDESRVFRFMAGAQGTKNDKTIGTQYIAASQDLTIKKPFMSVNISMAGDETGEPFVGRFNNPIEVGVSWFNNLDIPITNAEIHLKLAGSAFDKYSVNPGSGLYQSANNEIIWTRAAVKDLSSVAPGEGGKVIFSLTPRDTSSGGRAVLNPNMTLSVNVNGSRLSESNVPESITSSAVRLVKIASNISLSGQVVRAVGPFVNTGPIPPRAEQQTTYTIGWSVYNTSSNVSSGQVVATLPPYVKWLGNVSPTTEDVRYDQTSGQVVWNIGNVAPYTGSGGKRRDVAFQVSLIPSVSQIGQTISLIGEANLVGNDDYTGIQLRDTKQFMDTRYTDTSFKDGNEIVTR
ncbi:hypothetical protein EB052_01810, partial [bacterium]|nr:hypothetical protein [bacterium]